MIKMRSYRPILCASVAAISLVAASAAYAAPEGGAVSRGSATISQNGKKTDIHQSSNKVILDWRSFDIGADEHTEFHQPSRSAIALNRINDTKASKIDGRLSANGNIMLINPNGVVFGKGAQVDVGSLTATTANIDNDDFMAGKMDFKHAGNADAYIVNQGEISVKEAGLVNFVAPKVVNDGVIVAKLGKVQLAAADSFTLDMAGDGLLQVEVSAEESQKIARNSGAITAEGGYVAVTAAKARGLIDSLVDNSGTIEASSMTSKGGKIILSAAGGTTKMSGSVKANGGAGGGEILIGGDYRGKGAIENSKTTEVSAGAIIEASGNSSGDGGKVIVWSDEKTDVAGTISAKGGALSGKGGFVETSSKKLLQVNAETQVAVGGKSGAGEWLIDPEDIVISDSGNDGNVATSDISSASINGTLNGGGSVTITTSGVIAGGGDIMLQNANINKSVANNEVSLTLQAHRSIVVNGSSINSTSGDALNVVLNADRDANQNGAIYIDGTSIITRGGYFVAGGGAGVLGGANGVLGDGDGTGADDIKAWGYAGRSAGVSIANTSSITTGAGAIIINGRGYDNSATTAHHGVNISSSSLHSTSGAITINAAGGASSTNAYGFHMSGGTISTQTGLINIAGVSGSVTTGANDSGIVMFGSSVIEATDTGSISLTGTGATGSDFNVGTSGINRIGSSTMTGDIRLNANRVAINDTDNTILTQGSIIIKPTTASTSIGIGGGAGILDLNDSELAQLNAGRKLIIGDSVAGEGDVIIDSWNLSGKSYSVEIYGNDITFQDTDATFGVDYAVNMGTGSFLAHAMDKTGDTGVLTANAMIRRNASGTATLDLRADQNIIFSAGSGLSSLTGLVNTILNADRDGDHDGAISLASANFTTNGGYFVAGGGSGTVDSDNNGILGDGGTGADNVAAWGNASYIDGVKLDFTNVTTGDGSIYIAGRGFDDAPSNDHRGVLLKEGDMRTENGSIYIKGTGGYGVNGNNGVRLHYGEIVSNGSGDIIIEGHSGDTSLPVWGFYNAGFSADGGLIETHGGLIDIKGYADVTGGRSYNDGVSLYDTRVINSSGGNISIYGERYAVTNPENYGIYILGNSNVTTDGDIILETATTPLYDVFVQNSTLRTTGSGNILASIDSLDLDTGGVIDSANDVIITPRTAGASITLGGTTGSVANFSDVSLSRITADRLIIGHSAGGNSDVIIDSWDLSGRSYDVEVYGNDITFQDTDATPGVDYAVNMGAGDFLTYAGDNGDMAVNAAINRGVSGTSVLDLRADNNITFGNSGNVAATTGAIDLIASANYDGAGGGAVTFNASSIDTNGGDIDVNGAVSVGADATWNARGGTIATDNNITLGANDLTMIADNVTIGGNITGGAGSVLTLKPYQNNRSIGLGGGAGDFNLTDAELAGLNVGRLIIGDAALGTGDVTINSWSLSGKSYDAELYGNNFTIAGMTLGSGNVTIGAGNDVSVTSAIGNSGAGGDIYINVGNDFTNSAGANGINAGTGGRFLIYADAVSNVVRGGITRGNLFNRTFAGDDPSTIDASFGSRFIFNEQPTLTVRANDVTLAYYDPAYNSFSYSVSGLVTGDTAPSALSGTPAYVTSQLNATDYAITPSMGTLASTLGYLITFQDGLLVMADNSGPTTPPTPPAPHNPPSLPGIPPSVEQQIQPPGLIAGSGYGVFPPMPGGIYGGDMAQISYDMAARKTALIRVNTSDSDAFLRMASGGYVIVDNPVAMYYDLCPYNASYCN